MVRSDDLRKHAAQCSLQTGGFLCDCDGESTFTELKQKIKDLEEDVSRLQSDRDYLTNKLLNTR